MVKPKWTGKATDIWVKFVGASRQTMHFIHLLTNKVVLQRYYGIRNAKLQTAGKRDPEGTTVKDTWDEIKRVWMQHVFLLLTIAEAMEQGDFKNLLIGFTQSALMKCT